MGGLAVTTPQPALTLAGTRAIDGLSPRAGGGARYRQDPPETAAPRERPANVLSGKSMAAPAGAVRMPQAAAVLLPSAGFLAQHLAQESLPADRRVHGDRLQRGQAAYRAVAGHDVVVVGLWRGATALI